ncbi:LysM peptidoglycan-binding domain-containing protein [Paenibacillus tengchongensis]|uniref:LysM peptidoglycan-binding domain-containing protein n=1 Tax=Paenibacillus tengchongensis TaxID=2608684 RepID=UPI00124D17B4|nr:LysM peptidoglycan-binding domain-containing protein [Paenibacillus tengchongensis]
MKIHMVKEGDTLYALSQKYGVPLQKIIDANPQISNPDVLTVGDKVKIPSGTVTVPDSSDVYYKHTVKQGDTLWKLSKAWGITLKEMIDANPQLKNPNALLTGEIVNIPKKTDLPIFQATAAANTGANPQATLPTVVDKTQVGGKTYTGPIEKPAEEPKTPTAPIEKASTAPIEKKTEQVAPIASPEPVPAPVNVSLPNKAPEVAPVQEIVHETQSLFVQISIPAEEAVVYEKPKEAEKSKVEPVAWKDENLAPCEKSTGYPGLNVNPYAYDCPPVYDPMSVMGVNNAGYMQPAAYAPEYVSPYAYPANVYPCPPDYPGAWYSYNAPVYGEPAGSAVSPVMDYNPYTVPQFGAQPVNLPWPPCGCGEPAILPYSYEQPMFGYPANMPPQPGVVSPYTTAPNAMPGVVSPYATAPNAMPYMGANAAINPLSSIPATPAYPGMENLAVHNRVPAILDPDIQLQETPVSAVAAAPEITEEVKAGSTAIASAKAASKAKTAQSSEKLVKTSSAKARSSRNAKQGTSRKSKNPWISN